MRLPEATIKQAILHPERLVRHEALTYFADSYSRDTEVMPLAIEAVETFGRGNSLLDVHPLGGLAQTEATVDWAVRELGREEDGGEDREVFSRVLSRLLCNTDPRLLVPRAEGILRAPGFMKELVPEFRERLELLAWDADRCWKELEDLSEKGKGHQYVSDVPFGHASRVVEALARQADRDVGRILDLLGREVEDFENDPMVWLEIFLVMLAGQMRLTQAVPLLVKKLHAMGEILSEECVTALAKIGSDAAAEAVTEGWLGAEWDYRIYAVDALKRVHSDTTVRKCLELLPREKDLDIKTWMADALLANFDPEGIEPVRQLVQRRAYDETIADLMGHLVAVSTVTGVTFPEYDVWKRQAEEKQATVERKTRELWRFLQSPMPAPAPVPPREAYVPPERKPMPFLREQKQVGRNDPCPCGSGKKFKKCCMNKPRPF